MGRVVLGRAGRCGPGWASLDGPDAVHRQADGQGCRSGGGSQISWYQVAPWPLGSWQVLP